MDEANAEPLTYDTIAEIMVARVPELAEAYEFADLGDQIAVTLFLGDAAKYVLDQTRASSDANEAKRSAIRRRVAAILELVERGLTHGENELASTLPAAFIEELDTDDGELFERVCQQLGPASLETVRRLTEFYHSRAWLDFLTEQENS